MGTGRDDRVRDERSGHGVVPRICRGRGSGADETPDRQRGEADHLWPEFLPGGEAVLFTVWPETGDSGNAQIAVLDLRTNTQSVLLRGGSHAHYVPSGHLVYVAGGGRTGTLHAVVFDARRLAVVGTPVPIIEGVAVTATGGLNAGVASNGTMVYVPRGLEATRSLVWVRAGGAKERVDTMPADDYQVLRLSPDDRRVVVSVRNDVWM